MKLKLISFLLIAALLAGLFAGCGQSATADGHQEDYARPRHRRD